MATTDEPLLFREVLECFARFPQRHDTLRGIAQWWLMENRVEWAVVDIQAALDELVARDFIVSWQTTDGQTRYKINPGCLDEVGTYLRNNVHR